MFPRPGSKTHIGLKAYGLKASGNFSHIHVSEDLYGYACHLFISHIYLFAQYHCSSTTCNVQARPPIFTQANATA